MGRLSLRLDWERDPDKEPRARWFKYAAAGLAVLGAAAAIVYRALS